MIKKILKKLLHIVLILSAIALVAIYGINSLVVDISSQNVISSEDAKEQEADAIIILGCGVRQDNTPTPMLRDRLDEGINLYKNSKIKKILMSGDHGQKEYDEVNVMKNYAIEKGVPSEDIFMDHAGFSTYESIYRAKEIFGIEKAIIVTQKFHIYRALYIAQKFEIDAYGVCSNPRKYVGESFNEMREMVARCKDFFTCIIKPDPTYLGKKIPVSGNGNITNG